MKTHRNSNSADIYKTDLKRRVCELHEQGLTLKAIAERFGYLDAGADRGHGLHINRTGWSLLARQHGPMAQYTRRSADGMGAGRTSSTGQPAASQGITVGVIVASAVSLALLMGG